jgi:hypothetical protein
MKIRPVGDELFHAERQGAAFYSFANAPKMAVNDIPNILYISHTIFIIKVQCNII